MFLPYCRAPYDSIKNVVKGTNNYAEEYTGCCYGTHAEMDNLKKVPYSRHFRNKYWKINSKSKKKDKRRRLIKVDILVIRVTKNKEMRMSKPCYHCTMRLYNCAFLKIKYVYYSTDENTIVRIKLKDMMQTDLHVSKGHRAQI